MAIIESDHRGRLIRMSDALGAYYYLGDDLGNVGDGAWSREEDAYAAWESCVHEDAVMPEADVQIDDRGQRIAECIYCHASIALVDVPAENDDETWSELEAQHGRDCEWIATRAHRRDAD